MTEPQVRAVRSLRSWAMLLLVLASGLTIDLWSKSWAFRDVPLNPQEWRANPHWTLPPQPPIEVLPAGMLNFQLVVNRGAVFGIGANQRFFFIAFTVAALLVGVIIFARMTAHSHRLAHLAIGLILAGGIGNLYDRVTFGFVRDFIHMLPGLHLPFEWQWPNGSPEMFPWVFNVADALLLIGMALLLVHMNRIERNRRAIVQRESAATQPV